ncbi:MAG: penicillin-binding transpeptidase domain-containing protein, partial [Saprospiraceae bacterium]
GNVYDEKKDHQNDVDIITSERSSGSILKPFLYCAALEEGLITPKGILEDIPTYIRGYQPLNYSQEYGGMVPADQSLAMSLNVPAVRLLQQYGILPFKEKLVKGGITTLHYSPDHYGLPLVLGGAEVTLWDVCGAYASMGRVLDHAIPYDYKYDNRDIHPPLIFQKKDRKAERRNGGTGGSPCKRSTSSYSTPNWRNGGTDSTFHTKHLSKHSGDDQTIVKSHPSESSGKNNSDVGATYAQQKMADQPTVWSAAGIWQTFEAMSTLRRPDQEGQWETFHSSRRIAWKTGTSFGFRDAWAVGITPSYTIGVWVGNADGEGRPGVIGIHAAAPILFDVLRMLEDDGSWWDVPYREMTPKLVCRESGWLAGPLCTQSDTTFIIQADNVPGVCAFHTTCFTDANASYRYNPDCISSETSLTNYFVVPAEAETYYKRYNPSYETMPPLHPSCATDHLSRQDIAIIYPRSGSKIYVPFEWDHKKSKAVFSAVHRSDTANVYWHLDKEYLGKTKEFHQIEIDPKPGVHHLVLQDEWGSVVETRFEVLEGNDE